MKLYITNLGYVLDLGNTDFNRIINEARRAFNTSSQLILLVYPNGQQLRPTTTNFEEVYAYNLNPPPPPPSDCDLKIIKTGIDLAIVHGRKHLSIIHRALKLESESCLNAINKFGIDEQISNLEQKLIHLETQLGNASIDTAETVDTAEPLDAAHKKLETVLSLIKQVQKQALVEIKQPLINLKTKISKWNSKDALFLRGAFLIETQFRAAQITLTESEKSRQQKWISKYFNDLKVETEYEGLLNGLEWLKQVTISPTGATSGDTFEMYIQNLRRNECDDIADELEQEAQYGRLSQSLSNSHSLSLSQTQGLSSTFSKESKSVNDKMMIARVEARAEVTMEKLKDEISGLKSQLNRIRSELDLPHHGDSGSGGDGSGGDGGGDDDDIYKKLAELKLQNSQTQNENSQLHSKVKNLELECRSKIALQEFKIGDLVLFVPKSSYQWVIFNANCPNYYLHPQLARKLGNRSFVLGRILSLEKCVVKMSMSGRSANPFNLDVGTEWVLVHAKFI